MREPQFDPETSQVRFDDARIIIGGVAIGRAEIVLQLDIDNDPVQAGRVRQAVADLAARGEGISVTFQSDPVDRPRRLLPGETVASYTPDPRLRRMGLNDRYCALAERTAAGTPQPVVSKQHFQNVDHRNGGRAYSALDRGIHERYIYAAYLDGFAVRDPHANFLGFDAVRFGDILQDPRKLISLRNFGQRSLSVMEQLRDQLYLPAAEKDPPAELDPPVDK